MMFHKRAFQATDAPTPKEPDQRAVRYLPGIVCLQGIQTFHVQLIHLLLQRHPLQQVLHSYLYRKIRILIGNQFLGFHSPSGRQ